MIFAQSAPYAAKIRTAAQIRDAIGAFGSRRRSVCMCHGTFDGVHPGHLRHFLAAKERADILVASLTADAFVTKGNYRPYYTEELRALQLASHEDIDFVLIDRGATPIDNIRLLQPDFFAKGFEYANENAATRREAEAVEAYGGQMLFTPGDYVSSSTARLARSQPDVSLDALAVTLAAHHVTFADLRTTLSSIAGLRVHVVGDTIVDSTTDATVIGYSNKTPTLSVQTHGRQDYIGGAAIVGRHMRAAGASVTLSTVIGDDQMGKLVSDEMDADGIELCPLVDTSRPTTNKNAVVASGYRILKMDTVDNRPLSDRLAAQLMQQVSETPADVVIFSDFRHGIFTRHSVPDLIDAIPPDAFKAADSQVASRWGNILDFTGFDLITPNEKEARFALGDQDTVVRPLVSKLYAEAHCGTLIMKMGERGVLVQSAPLGEPDYLHAISALTRNVVDAVGAGDALLAYAALSIRAGGNPLIGSVLGSIAAAIECEHDGNFPVSTADVVMRLDAIERQLSPDTARSAA